MRVKLRLPSQDRLWDIAQRFPLHDHRLLGLRKVDPWFVLQTIDTGTFSDFDSFYRALRELFEEAARNRRSNIFGKKPPTEKAVFNALLVMLAADKRILALSART